MRLLFISALSISLFAGQSLRLTSETGTWTGGSDFATPRRVEFKIHNIGTGPSNSNTILVARNVRLQWNGGGNQWWIAIDGRSIGTPCTINPAAYPNGVVVRYQYDPSQGTYGKEICERWDAGSANTRTVSTQLYSGTYTATYGNQVVGQTNGEVSIEFLKVYDTLVAENSRRPLPSDTAGNLDDFTFNNTLANGGSGGNIAGIGSPVYVTSPTPFILGQFTAGPSATWTTSLPCRAGAACQLTDASFSTGDSNSLTHFWQQVSGATTLRWSSRTAASPTFTGCTFGPYTIRHYVSDGSISNTTDMEVGCVAMDSNGVVVTPDSRIDTFLGPMIALGRNPWTWADERQWTGAGLRNAAYGTPGFASWQSGTVAWERAGNCVTSLAADINATDTTISVSNAAGCDWSTFPVYVQIGGYFGEVVSICNRSSNTLTACTYGRGFNGNPRSWDAGYIVEQFKVTGTGTGFLTTLCPAGPGPGGTVYETGTVTVTNGSAAITRASGGTTWTVSGEPTGRTIRIDGGGGTVYVGSIASVQSGTTATLSRNWLGSNGTYTYHILNGDRQILALEWNDPALPDNPATPNGNMMPFTLAGCVSDTIAYGKDRYEAFGSGSVSGERYTYHDYPWLNGNGFGPNYYDEVLANYALHYRSGLSMPLTAARKLSRYWAKNPELMGGFIGSPPRTLALGGSFFAAVIDGQSEDWPILRRKVGTSYDTQPCNQDLRETAYIQSHLALAALFDPDNTQRATWKTELGKMYTYDNGCKGANNDYPTSATYITDQTGVDLTATNGSRDVTGTGIPASACDTTAGSNGSISNGSAALTGTGFVSGQYIAVAGTRSGQPWIQFETMTYNSSSSITLGQAWQGDTCSSDCKWYVFGGGSQYFVVGGMYDRTKTADQLLTAQIQNNACEWISSSTIRLALPFTGTTGSTYRYGKYNLFGNGTQVYMAGIKAYAMNYASKIDDAPLAANYTTLLRSLAQWILNTGTFDPNDGVQRSAIFYARGFDDCEPATIGSWHPYLCAPNPDLNGEATVALRNAYEADSGLLAKIDRMYGSTWGKPGWTTGGVYTSPVDLTFPADVNFNYKYYGLMFGMGFAHQWPAARLGGVAPAAMTAFTVDLEKPSWADNMRIRVIQPNGVEVNGTCTSTTCTVNSSVDLRQGTHEVLVEYRNASNVVLRTARLQKEVN